MVNAAPLALLLVAWLLLAVLGHDLPTRSWLLPGVGIAALGLVVAVFRMYPRRPRSLSLGLVGIFALYVVWVGFSAVWAGALEPVWYDAALAGLYLVVLGIACTFLTDGRARVAFRYLLIASATALLAVVTFRLWTTDPAGTDSLFLADRLTYPLGYANGSAALFLLFFWPLLWLAADAHERAPIRGLALGTAAALLCPWVLTQSRGGLWALLLSGALTFALSPARLRTMTFLLAPAGVLVWAFPQLNEYWTQGAVELGGRHAGQLILEGFLIAAAVGWVLAALEPWVTVSRRMKAGFGLVVGLGLMTALVFGYISFERAAGDPGEWVSESWRKFTAEEVIVLPLPGRPASTDTPAQEAGSRFATISAGGRWELWSVARTAFRADPWAGTGAGNFVYAFDRMRTRETSKPPEPHSVGLRTLAETGSVGALLLLGAFALGVGGALWPRFNAGWHRVIQRRRRRPAARAPEPDGSLQDDTETGSQTAPQSFRWGLKPRRYAWETALVVGFCYWAIHASVDRLWISPAVTIVPLLMLAATVASIDAWAGIMWPRWARFLPFLRAGLILMVPPMLKLSKRRAAIEAADATPIAPVNPGADQAFTGYRRADRYATKRKRRYKRAARRSDTGRRLFPPGPLSIWFRRLAILTCLAVLLALALPYASLRLQQAALGNADLAGALSQSHLASWLFPVSPKPVTAEAQIYEARGRAAPEGDAGNGSRLDALALALDAHQRAIALDGESWSLRYEAAMAALSLANEMTKIEESVAPVVAEPGQGEGSPARSQAEIEVAARFRALPVGDVEFLAESHLKAAAERNPSSREVAAIRSALETHRMSAGTDP